jgi:hypothetical protein
MKKIVGFLIIMLLSASSILSVIGSGTVHNITACNCVVNAKISKLITFSNYDNDDVLDQNQSDDSGWSWTTLIQGSMLAQSFKPSLNVLTRVELLLVKVGSPHELTISIRSNLSDEDLTSLNILGDEIPRVDSEWIEFDFSDIGVVPEQTYYIVWYPIGIDSTNYIGWNFGDNNPYDRGDAYEYSPTRDWEIIEGSPERPDPDFCFKTYGVTNNPPTAPMIHGPLEGNVGTEYTYRFVATDPEGHDVSFFIDWDDGTTSEWIILGSSGEEVEVPHTWDAKGKYTIRAKAKDESGAEGEWGELTINMPKANVVNLILLEFLERSVKRVPMFARLPDLLHSTRFIG